MAIGINLGDDEYTDDSTGSMFGPKPGSWYLHSKKDPRWNVNGTGSVGGFVMSAECEAKLEELKKLYGEMPDDLEHGYMKL